MPEAPAISVIILTYNEEPNVRHALDSVRWCDNVVLVDSFSQDRTAEICREYPNVIFLEHAFENFAAQRQYALESGHVRHDWVLALDADERVPPELRDELIAIAARNDPDGPVAYDIAMRIYMWGKWLKYSSEYPAYWRRFLHSGYCRFVQEGHADKVVVNGRTATTRHDLIHHDMKGITDWIDKHNKYTTLEATYALGPLRNIPLRAIFSKDRATRRSVMKRVFRALPGNALLRFFYLYVLRLGFLDGSRGFDFCTLRAFQHFIVKVKMYEMRHNASQCATVAPTERQSLAANAAVDT